MRVVASFTGFLPIDNPQLVCMIVVDEPAVPVMEASGIAAPWVNAVLTDLVQYYGILPDETTNHHDRAGSCQPHGRTGDL